MLRVNKKAVYNYLLASTMLAYAINVNIASILILLLIVLFVFDMFNNTLIKKDWADNVWMLYITTIPAVLNLLRTHEFHTYLIIGYFLAAVAFLHYQSESIEELFVILKFVAIIEATSVYIQAYFPAAYNVLARTLLRTSYDEIILRQSAGYYTGFTKEVSFTVWFIIIGIACLYSDCLIHKKKGAFVKLVYLIVALLMTGKKAQPLVMLIAILMVSVIISNKRMRIIKLLFWALLVVSVIYITFPVWAKWDFMQRYVALINNILLGADLHVITTGRSEIYNDAIEFWKSNKLFGIGWGNFRFDVAESAWYSWFDVHNCYLQLLCETGIIGLGIYLALIILLIYRTLTCMYRINNLDREDRKNVVIISIILYFFLGYSITGTCLYEYSYYIVFFLCIKKCNSIYRMVRSSS